MTALKGTDSKWVDVFSRGHLAVRRFGKFLDKTLIREAQRLQALIHEDYESIRDRNHLYRLALSLYLIQKAMQARIVDRSDGKHTIVRVIRSRFDFAFENKEVLTFVIGEQLMVVMMENI